MLSEGVKSLKRRGDLHLEESFILRKGLKLKTKEGIVSGFILKNRTGSQAFGELSVHVRHGSDKKPVLLQWSLNER